MPEATSAASEAAAAQAAPESGGSLRGRALKGAVWTVGGYGFGQVLRLGSNLVLTRLLFPEVFGLMALVNVVLQGLQMFSDIGLAPSIIQHKRGDEPSYLNTAWTIQIIRGIGLWMICVGLAWPLAQFYGEATLLWILPVSGLTAAIAGLNSPAIFVANRRLHLHWLTLLELGTQVAGIAVMIVWALMWPSVWALVAGGVVSAVTKMLLSHLLLPGERCRLQWNGEAARALFTFGRWIFVSTVLTFLVTQGDRLIFGKLLTMEQLGIYSIAVMISMFPIQIVQRLTGMVVFPAYSDVVRSGRGLTSAFHQARHPLVILGAVLTAVLIADGRWVIEFLYDERYAGAGWMLQLIAASILLRVFESTNGAALLAAGKAAEVAAGSAVKLVGMAVLVPVGWWLAGLQGALVALIGAEAAKYCLSALLVRRSGLDVLTRDLGIVLGVAATAVVGWVAGQILESRAGAHVLLTAAVVGVLVTLLWLPALWPAGRRLLERKSGRDVRAAEVHCGA